MADLPSSDVTGRTVPSSHGAVADAVRRWIALGTYAPGERLPSERELAESFAVGRMTVRRAMRELAAEGLVVTARGRTGGTTVCAPTGTPTAVDRAALQRVVRDSFDFRIAVEPAGAALAAERASAADLRALDEQLVATASSFGGYRSLDSRFHLALATAADNPLILEAVASSRAHFFGWADALRRNTAWDDLSAQERDFARQHRPIADAVRAGDVEAAREITRSHLLEGERFYLDLVSRAQS